MLYNHGWEKQQTQRPKGSGPKRVRQANKLLLDLVSDAYLTANRTRYMWSSTQETTPLDHASPTTTRSQAAGNDSRLYRAGNTQNPLCGKTKAAPHDRLPKL